MRSYVALIFHIHFSCIDFLCLEQRPINQSALKSISLKIRSKSEVENTFTEYICIYSRIAILKSFWIH